MNFEILSNTRFKIGVDYYKRIYQVQKKRNGKIKIRNILTGEILFDNLEFNQVTINGQPLTNIDDLQNIIYNFSCICDHDLEDENFRIFDNTFDNTFE